LTGFVVDASVALKWFLPEVHSDAAARLLREGYRLHAPDLIRAEFGNVLWKKWRRKEIAADAARCMLRDFLRFPLDIHTTDNLLPAAWEIAEEFERTVYDSLYVALAQKTGNCLVTADGKLYNALKATRLRPMLMWVEEIPA
jgi:predicted nucleic acid-binding protein